MVILKLRSLPQFSTHVCPGKSEQDQSGWTKYVISDFLVHHVRSIYGDVARKNPNQNTQADFPIAETL